MKEDYNFFTNKNCRFYPCHPGLEDINCLFCFCPLYSLSDCGGSYKLTDKGIKDCSGCVRPHIPGNYEIIINKLKSED